MARKISRSLILFVCATALAVATDAPSTPETLIENGHFKQARTMLEKRLAANASDADAVLQMALVKLEFREVEPALQLAEKAVSLKPNDARAHSALADCYGQKAEGDVGMFEGLKLLRAFKKENETALAIDPKNYNALHSWMEFTWERPESPAAARAKQTRWRKKSLPLTLPKAIWPREKSRCMKSSLTRSWASLRKLLRPTQNLMTR
jgi:tetratricopeptide (TPR) repeat protein